MSLSIDTAGGTANTLSVQSQSLQSALGDWSFYKAITTVNLNDQTLNNVHNINANRVTLHSDLSTRRLFVSDLITSRGMYVPTSAGATDDGIVSGTNGLIVDRGSDSSAGVRVVVRHIRPNGSAALDLVNGYGGFTSNSDFEFLPDMSLWASGERFSMIKSYRTLSDTMSNVAGYSMQALSDATHGPFVRHTFNLFNTIPNAVWYRNTPVSIGSSTSNFTSDFLLRVEGNTRLQNVTATDITLNTLYANESYTAGRVWRNVVSSDVSTSNSWRNIVYGNGQFVGVGFGSDTRKVITSPDGINWTGRVPVSNVNWFKIIYANGLYVASAFGGGTQRIMTSIDAINWTLQTHPSTNIFGLGYGNGYFVAGGQNNVIIYSTDAINWTSATVNNADGAQVYSFVYGNNGWVAVANSGSGAVKRVFYSTDSINWEALESPQGLTAWHSVDYGNGLYVAVAGTGTQRSMYSTDGINWTLGNIDATKFWWNLRYADGLWMAVGDDGAIQTSPDGLTWTTQTPTNATDDLIGVGYGNGMWVALSYSGNNRVKVSGKVRNHQPENENILHGNRLLNGNLTVNGSISASDLTINGGISLGDITATDLTFRNASLTGITSNITAQNITCTDITVRDIIINGSTTLYGSLGNFTATDATMRTISAQFIETSTSDASFVSIGDGAVECSFADISFINTHLIVGTDAIFNSVTPFTGAHIGFSSQEFQQGICLAPVTHNDFDVFGTTYNIKKASSSDVVIGVYAGKNSSDQILMNAVGEGGVLCNNENGNIHAGDLLVVSSVKGVCMKQSDDIIRSRTVAKALFHHVMTEEPQLIPCVYLCG